MSPSKHLASGLILGGAVYAAAGDPAASALALAASVLCDCDHILEYTAFCVQNKSKWTFAEFSGGTYFRQKGTLYIIFHAYEYLLALLGIFAALAIFTRAANIYLLSVILGYSLHMILDTIGNGCSLKGYFITYRRSKRWREAELCAAAKSEVSGN